MPRPSETRPLDRTGPTPAGGRLRAAPAIVTGLLAFAFSLRLGGAADIWMPALGLGMVLLSWTGWWMLPLLLGAAIMGEPSAAPGASAFLDAPLLVGQVGLSWWAYHKLARGSRWLDDPRSCMLFLGLVPGLVAAAFALTQAVCWTALHPEPMPFWPLVGSLWLSRILGVLVPAPLLLALGTPLLAQAGLLRVGPPSGALGNPWQRWSRGETVEVAGLALSSAVLTLVVLRLHMRGAFPPWSLWGVGLLIVVWSALRQGLRGGVLVAASAGILALLIAEPLGLGPAERGPLQGLILAQSSTALLVGVSASWVQSSEARYRHVVSEVPLVLYSAHLPQPLRVPPAGSHDPAAAPLGPIIGAAAVVTLVSRASQQVFNRRAEEMVGPYAQWLGRVFADDRELVIAALAQLGLQHQPVTCEYRIATTETGAPAEMDGPRWVRDSLTPHYTEDGRLDGWEGFIEDVTEQRRLAYNLRRSTLMLRALVAHLPAGIFFVQGPMGFPLLANARARQLLGQREDAGAPLIQLSQRYRLHRPDGTPYPADELPVSRALHQGLTCTADDVVVHRTDGRRIALITWAAPVQLNGDGRADAAVWVLEEKTGFPHAASAPPTVDGVLGTMIEVMSDGVLVQDGAGVILACNLAACTILGVPRAELLGRPGLPPHGWIAENGQAIPVEGLPDRRALRQVEAVRDVVMGIVIADAASPRWLRVSAVPLPVDSAAGTAGPRARLVTTLVEIHRDPCD